MTQEQAEERALRTCEAAGGLGCNIVGSLCASPNGERGTYSGSESVLPVEGAQAAFTTEAEHETLTREERVLLQQSLTALGFDTGPADGVFGQRTRSAIREWQGASGYEATGEVTRDQFTALRTSEVSPDQEQESEPRQEAADNQSGKVLVFGPDTGPKCADGETTEDGFCWWRFTNKPDCYFLGSPVKGQFRRLTWSGRCVDNMAHGRGTIGFQYVIVERDFENSGEDTGEMAYGHHQGRWMMRNVVKRPGDTRRKTWESQYVDGKKVGWVTERREDGHVVQHGTTETGSLDRLCQRHKPPGENRWIEYLLSEDGCP